MGWQEGRNGEVAKLRNGEVAKWRNGEVTKWRNGGMPLLLFYSLLNNPLSRQIGNSSAEAGLQLISGEKGWFFSPVSLNADSFLLF